MTFALFEDYRSPLDAQNASERKLRARHWMRLRRAQHYGTADLVARAFVILALLLFFALLSNAGVL